MRERTSTEVYLEADRSLPAESEVRGDPYLEVAPAGDAPQGERVRVRALDRAPGSDDGAWRVVLDALLAGRPLLLALWPTAAAANVLETPPPGSAG